MIGLPSLFQDKQVRDFVVLGGAAATISGALMHSVRTLPAHLWSRFLNRFSVVLDMTNDNEAFAWFMVWLSEQEYSKKSRSLSVEVKWRGGGMPTTTDGDAENEVLLYPAPGNHFFFRGWRPVWLYRKRDEDGKKNSEGVIETLSIRIVGQSQKHARDLIEEVKLVAQARHNRTPRIYANGTHSWMQVGYVPQRTIKQVYLPEALGEDVLKDIQEFLHAREWYDRVGVPWRRGYLLCGLPGTGKTSLVTAIANELRMHIYALNLAACLGDNDLLASVHTQKPNSILLLEDIDVAATAALSREGHDVNRQAVTLAGLLNVLDGISSTTGSIVIMTTNRPEALDSALMRPGRVDRTVEFTHATTEQIKAVFSGFYGGHEALAAQFAAQFMDGLTAPVTVAEVVQYLMQYRTDPDGAVRQHLTLAKVA